MTSASETTNPAVARVPLRGADDAALARISREGMLSLTLEEMKAIQSHFARLDRDPTDGELETLAQTWSEHCVHKTFKARYRYREEERGTTPSIGGERAYENLLKDTIARATEELGHDWCLSVFKDNAGVIDFDGVDAVSFKVETHNHPSALEPYGGAGTGIGGVIRDVLGCGLGGKPVLNTDVFCFGPLDTPAADLPTGALHPKRIAQGVIAGVRDYGNRMGIPTANGAVYFDRGYVGNPLVFCGTVGIMPRTAIEKSVEPGDLVVVMGGRTGRDGIHGATFSSAPLESGITSSVVQIGHAIVEKKTMDVLLQARDKGLYRSVTDCGAGGFSSAIGELGAETGVRVDLALAPLKYPGLAPWEIWISESQERMVLAVPPENWSSLKVLCQQEDVEAVAVGEFTGDKTLRVFHGETAIAEIDMAFLHDGVPKLDLEARWNAPEFVRRHRGAPTVAPESGDKAGDALRWLLAHPVIASKERVIRQYDHEVQGGSIVKPLMGPDHDGPTDACVFRPKLSGWRGVGVSNGLNPRAGKIDPYAMAKLAVDEAYRNLIAVGGGLRHVAILDNFCWGEAKDSLELGGLVRAAEACKESALAYKLPFISGKDSFNNTWRRPDGVLESIPPTLLVSAIGVIDDVRQCVTSGLKRDGSVIYLVGETGFDLAGSLIADRWGAENERVPNVDFKNALALYKKLQTAMRYRLILACHDVSEGGWAVAAAEMAFGGVVGLDLTVPEAAAPLRHLFSESPSRFVVEVPADKKSEFEQSIGLRGAVFLGQTTKKNEFRVSNKGEVLVHESVPVLKTLWKDALKAL